MSKFTEYKLPQLKGITDLQDVYPGQSAEWWSKEDWEKWEADKPKRVAADREYIEELKRTGEFGKPYDITIRVQHNPIFDEPSTKTVGFTSFGILIPDDDNTGKS